MKVILTASGTFALPSLEIMAARLSPDNLLVISQPDRRRGRGRQYQPTPIKQRALELGLSVITPEKIGSQEDIEISSKFAADFLVVIDYGQLIPRGDILLQRKTEIKASETSIQLTERLQKLGAELLWETLEKWQAGLIKPVPQDNDQASYAPKLHKKDGLLDWKQDAHELERRIRALNPWPGTFTFWRGKRLKVLAATIIPIEMDKAQAPGTIQVSEERLYAACGRGFIQITKVQPEGRQPQNSSDFLRGHHLTTGEQFNSQEKVSSP